MSEDPRCCGTGTCIIDPEGRCWCGQQWDGEKMAAPSLNLKLSTLKNLEQDSDKTKPES